MQKTKEAKLLEVGKRIGKLELALHTHESTLANHTEKQSTEKRKLEESCKEYKEELEEKTKQACELLWLIEREKQDQIFRTTEVEESRANLLTGWLVLIAGYIVVHIIRDIYSAVSAYL